MARLDRLRPYAEHWGPSGMCGYQQDGHNYDLAGRLIDPKRSHGNEPAAGGRPAERPPPARPVRPKPTHADSDPRTDAELRTLVEIAGGAWDSRAAAIEFLAGGEV